MTLLIEEPKQLTDEEFLLSSNGENFELVDGRLVERKQMGVHANFIATYVLSFLFNYCREHNAGAVFGSEMMYRCFGPGRTFRKPDVSFIRLDRLSADQLKAGAFTIVPDLIVEVTSPSDLVEELEEKLLDYANAGVPLVWVLHPTLRTVRVHRADGTLTALRETDTIEGEGILPGFSIAVASLFPAFPPQ